MTRKFKFLAIILSLVFVVCLLPGSANLVSAASTSKRLSTNFTLVNLKDTAANVTVEYKKPDGTNWGASVFTNFSIAPGANEIVRQYFDPGLTAGNGSVVVASDQELGALVQVMAREGVPSMSAYTGVSQTSSTWYVPMLARHGGSASGVVNSQISIQNTGEAADISVALYARGAAAPTMTKVFPNVPQGGSVLFDLEPEAGLGENWWGSAKVTSSSALAVVSNMFTGADALISFNGTPQENLKSSWFIPYLYIRLANTLTTSIIIQNLSGTQIPVDDVSMTCTKDSTAPGSQTFTVKNDSAISNNSAYGFNTHMDVVRFPEAGWYGGCKISSASGKQFTVLIQYRMTSNPGQSAYEAVPGDLQTKEVTIPLVAKRLANGFATSFAVQNLSDSDATATITYTPEGGVGAPIVRNGVLIPANASIQRNFRLSGTEGLPDGWVGSVTIVADKPIAAFVANWNLRPSGDQMQAYLAFHTNP
jgi:hypothetical protein